MRLSLLETTIRKTRQKIVFEKEHIYCLFTSIEQVGFFNDFYSNQAKDLCFEKVYGLLSSKSGVAVENISVFIPFRLNN